MKPRWLGIVAALASVGLGYWLITQPHTSRELLLAMAAWLLGFWVASGIRSPAPEPSNDDETDEEFDDEGDEDYDEEAYEDR